VDAETQRAQFARAFTEWDRRYRENPEDFMGAVAHLLGTTPATYGELCAVYFQKLLNEVE
jgi:hypothetical protein